ncbi:uncharacterized protein [Triticum aestivum]|uniref:uncharacterized protein n=1 Tax=Triticum aestivum TaxID=4565 RepID=UPI001D0312BF|nr:uncharacterized protein LOC123164060 [Triticum aestivum]
MAMERFLMALVFCEAPLDSYGTTVLTAGMVKRLALGGSGATKPIVTSKAGAKKLQGNSMAQRWACSELAFDGLGCFNTVVMH